MSVSGQISWARDFTYLLCVVFLARGGEKEHTINVKYHAAGSPELASPELVEGWKGRRKMPFAYALHYSEDKGALAMIDPGLNGKVALITGANSPYGIGAAAARAFAAQGAAVFITYLRPRIDLSPQASEAPGVADAPGEAFYQAAQQLTAETVIGDIRAAGGRPEDVADAMLLLAAEQARWITGQVIYVGGGHRMI
jgi:hypothetical protein